MLTYLFISNFPKMIQFFTKKVHARLGGGVLVVVKQINMLKSKQAKSLSYKSGKSRPNLAFKCGAVAQMLSINKQTIIGA